MENITIGQILGAIAILSTIGGFFVAIIKMYKTNFLDKFDVINKRLDKLEEKSKQQDLEIKDSKEERLLLIKGQLACLKGLKEQGCNGPVTEAINNMENYLVNKSHT